MFRWKQEHRKKITYLEISRVWNCPKPVKIQLHHPNNNFHSSYGIQCAIIYRGGSRGRVQGVRTPPPPEMTCGFLIQLVFFKKKKTMWFIGVEVEQETSAPPPKKILDPPLINKTRRTSAWTRPSFSSYNDRAPRKNVHYVIMHYSPYEILSMHENRPCGS